MAGENDDEIRVTIDPALEGEGSAADETQIIKVDDGKNGKKVESANDDALEDLKTQYAGLQGQVTTANQRAARAEEDARTARQQLDESNLRAHESDKRAIDGGLQAAKEEADAAQAEYERAFEAGDAKAAATAQRKIARAEANILRLTEAADNLGEAPKPKADQRRVDPAAGTGDGDRTEAWIQTRSPAAQTFLRKHLDAVRDPARYRRIEAAHHHAVAEGIEVESKEYFDHIEELAGLKGKAAPKTGEQRQRRQAAPAAPGGDVSGPAGGGAREVRLSASEARSAQDGTIVWNYDDPKGRFKKGDPIGVQEFARRKLAMSAEGRYNLEAGS